MRPYIQTVLGEISPDEMGFNDTVYKSMLRKYGGFGYAHLQQDMLPLMLAEG